MCGMFVWMIHHQLDEVLWKAANSSQTQTREREGGRLNFEECFQLLYSVEHATNQLFNIMKLKNITLNDLEFYNQPTIWFFEMCLRFRLLTSVLLLVKTLSKRTSAEFGTKGSDDSDGQEEEKINRKLK